MSYKSLALITALTGGIVLSNPSGLEAKLTSAQHESGIKYAPNFNQEASPRDKAIESLFEGKNYIDNKIYYKAFKSLKSSMIFFEEVDTSKGDLAYAEAAYLLAEIYRDFCATPPPTIPPIFAALSANFI